VRDLAVLSLHLLATVAGLAGPGGARSVVAESVLVKHQLGDAFSERTIPTRALGAMDIGETGSRLSETIG